MGQRTARVLPWVVSGLLLVCLAFLAGQGRPASSSQPTLRDAGELRAQSFVVVDGDGKERARLGIAPHGGAELVVRSGSGEAAALVAATDRLPILGVRARDGNIVGELGLMDETSPVFILRDPSGRRRIALYVTKDEHEARVDVFSESGKSSCSLQARQDGLPQLIVSDEQGQPRILLGALPDGSCVLDLLHSSRTRVRAAVAGSGDAGLVVFDKDGQPVWWDSKGVK
jgi:hypothetical protein